jgi:2-amino-4-hydroxy-6-hydroxymethyldihydropteridine diphosphokinase
VGDPGQPPFHNAVVALGVPAGTHPDADALALLAVLKQLERAFGRQPRERWGPRELDLDLLVFGRHRVHVERPGPTRSVDAQSDPAWLDVPHPHARERLFVLAPLADLAPALVPPGWGETVASARRRQETLEGADAVHPVGRWRPLERRWDQSEGRNAE